MVLVPNGAHSSKWFHDRAIEWVSMIFFHKQDSDNSRERKELDMRDNSWTCMTSLRVWPLLVDFAMIAIRTRKAEVTLTQYQGRVMMYMNAAGPLFLIRS